MAKLFDNEASRIIVVKSVCFLIYIVTFFASQAHSASIWENVTSSKKPDLIDINGDDSHEDCGFWACSGEDWDEKGPWKLSDGAIVGIVIAVFAIFFVIPVVVCFCCAWCCFRGRRGQKAPIVAVAAPIPQYHQSIVHTMHSGENNNGQTGQHYHGPITPAPLAPSYISQAPLASAPYPQQSYGFINYPGTGVTNVSYATPVQQEYDRPPAYHEINQPHLKSLPS